ncbi:M4 family metallopeptidase [Streptomyces sp. TRM64462]|uniref:M4 family metallopeptidase n=1 Tax=Streptomyces sp. TRM64462 TaxID=2741726 RepID=UPI0028156857|nr:M4 family metallopeptidase [Streptomyces sp. TRM64462]
MRHARGIRTGATATGGAALIAAAGLLITALPAQAAAPQAATAAPGAATAAPPTADVIPLPRTDTPALVDGIREPVDAKAAPADAARGHLAAKEDRYKIAEPRRDLVPVQTLKQGRDETVRFQQEHRGVPVLGGQYVVRMETGSGKRAVTGTSGKYFTGLTAGTKPAVAEETAVRRAVSATLTRLGGHRLTKPAAGRAGDAGRADGPSLRGSANGLVVIPRGEGVLAYHVTVRGTHPATGATVLQHVYVDARAGYPVLQYSGIKTLTPPKTPGTRTGTGTGSATKAPGSRATTPGTPGTPATGSGVRLDGTTVPLNVHRPAADGPYVLADHARMAAGTKNTLTTWDARGRDVYDVAGTWPGDLKEFASPTAAFGKEATDSGAVDAHWAAGEVYDYYKERHGRDGLDGRGSTVNSLVGVTDFGGPYVNAFWDGTKMVYGSGDDTYKPLSADLDVVGHEMTHGVVENTANLVYAGQSGALNEAFADYFGNAIDVDSSGTAMDDPDAGLIGEDLCRDAAKPRDCAFRDLDDGATTSKDFLGVTFGTDNGGVHLNSTIFSGALWDLRQDLGPVLADRIAYKALTEYLTPLDGFTEGRAAVVAAAKDLGVNARQLRAAKRSFDAHGIVPGWEKALGVDSDTLLRKVNTEGVGVQAGGGWWTTSLSNDDGSEPYSVYAGRADGKGAPRIVSPNDGRYHVLSATDGRTVVWAAYGPEGIDVLSRPVAGGPIKKLLSTDGDIMALRVDGGVTAFDLVDFSAGNRRVGYFRQGDPTPTYVDAGRDDVTTGLPALAHGRIAYGKVYADDSGAYRLGIEVRDLSTGRSRLVEQLGEPQGIGGTGLNSRHVFWLSDENIEDDGQVGIHRAGADPAGPAGPDDGHGTYAISSEYKPGALVATDLTVSETAVTVGAVPVSDSPAFSNASLPKVWQLSTDGARVQRLSCNRGEQSSPAAVSGTQVVWLDGTTGWTNVVTRHRPAGNCG